MYDNNNIALLYYISIFTSYIIMSILCSKILIVIQYIINQNHEP